MFDSEVFVSFFFFFLGNPKDSFLRMAVSFYETIAASELGLHWNELSVHDYILKLISRYSFGKVFQKSILQTRVFLEV